MRWSIAIPQSDDGLACPYADPLSDKKDVGNYAARGAA